MDPHQAPSGLLRERIECQPAGEGGLGLLQFEGFLLKGGEPIEDLEQAHLPLVLLLLDPYVKAGLLAQPEAVEEGAAHQGESVLEQSNQSGLLLSLDRGESHGLVGLLHHVQVQL